MSSGPGTASSSTPQPLDLDALFGRQAPRVVEIGFGNGENLAALATAHPERDFLGIEVHKAGVGRLMLACETAQLTNVRISSHDAVEVLEHQIAPESLDEMLILFPDPWHKKRHHKRRLVQPPFISLAVESTEAGRHPAPRDGLGAVRDPDARSAERERIARERVARRRLRGEARVAHHHALREAWPATRAWRVGSRVQPPISG